jgi:hypothetical protein
MRKSMDMYEDNRCPLNFVGLFQATRQRVQLLNGVVTCNQRDAASREWQRERVREREMALPSHISRHKEDASVETWLASILKHEAHSNIAYSNSVLRYKNKSWRPTKL